MSIVDGCVLVVCSGADGRFRPLADWTDRADLLIGYRVPRASASVPARTIGSRGNEQDLVSQRMSCND
jgi:hypothetical protein